jgi:hypothetical protein
MPAEGPSPSEQLAPADRITAAFALLTESARQINAVSIELLRSIASLEDAINRLNVGVACWTEFNEGSDGAYWWRESIGYADVNGKWCIAIQKSQGSEYDPERSSEKTYEFNHAPRYMRVKAVDKLPDLIEALVKATDATTERLQKKVTPTRDLAVAVNEFVSVQDALKKKK